MYTLDVLLSQFGTSLLSHVQAPRVRVITRRSEEGGGLGLPRSVQRSPEALQGHGHGSDILLHVAPP